MRPRARKFTAEQVETTIIALRYGISHAEGVALDDGEIAEIREKAERQVKAMQALHKQLTGAEFQ